MQQSFQQLVDAFVVYSVSQMFEQLTAIVNVRVAPMLRNFVTRFVCFCLFLDPVDYDQYHRRTHICLHDRFVKIAGCEYRLLTLYSGCQYCSIAVIAIIIAIRFSIALEYKLELLSRVENKTLFNCVIRGFLVMQAPSLAYLLYSIILLCYHIRVLACRLKIAIMCLHLVIAAFCHNRRLCVFISFVVI